jgi:predicted ATP-dependent endonuclease of OLD family
MTVFKKFTIINFRAFSDNLQTLEFGIPVAQKIGSGLTYIVGANNSGKTTIIECLSLRNDSKVRSSEKGVTGNPEFTLYNTDNQIVRKATLIRPESYTIQENPILLKEDLPEIISSRRHWESLADRNGATQDFLSETAIQFNRHNQSIQTASILKNIEKDVKKYDLFISLIKRIIPEFSKFAIGYEEREFIEYISGAGTKHRSDFLGDGVISVIRILAHLFESNKPLIIDEPELSLHPLAQKQLSKLIADYAQTRQIIISTHSPYFIDWEFIQNGAKVNRITKEEDKVSKIYTLKDYGIYKPLINGGNWQQPYLVDIVAKEVFFQENILFLEGQEDVGLLKEEFKDTDINIFGYGVRGYTGFEFALKLVKDIGLKKAAVILDSPIAGNEKNELNENTIKEDLEGKFPDYKIFQWEKDDIRDKDILISKPKSGYFTKEGKLKPENELGDFRKKIQLVKDFFK